MMMSSNVVTVGWWMCGVGGVVGWAPPSYLKKCTAEKGDSDDSDDDFMATADSCKIVN